MFGDRASIGTDSLLRPTAVPATAGLPTVDRSAGSHYSFPGGTAVPEEETLYVASPSMFRNHPIGFIATMLLSVVGVGLIIFLVWYLRARSTELTVTNLRTRLHRGWLSRSITEVWHRDIRNVQLTQTLAQRILGTGRIGISSSGQAGIEIDVSGLRDPDTIKALIDRYRAEAKKD